MRDEDVARVLPWGPRPDRARRRKRVGLEQAGQGRATDPQLRNVFPLNGGAGEVAAAPPISEQAAREKRRAEAEQGLKLEIERARTFGRRKPQAIAHWIVRQERLPPWAVELLDIPVLLAPIVEKLEEAPERDS